MKVLSHFLDWRINIAPGILKNVIKPMEKRVHIHDRTHALNTVRFSRRIKDSSLRRALHRARELAHQYNGTLQLYPDFAPQSFAFVISTESNKCKLAGAIIYHGGTEQVFATTVTPTEGWALHT